MWEEYFSTSGHNYICRICGRTFYILEINEKQHPLHDSTEKMLIGHLLHHLKEYRETMSKIRNAIQHGYSN